MPVRDEQFKMLKLNLTQGKYQEAIEQMEKWQTTYLAVLQEKLPTTKSMLRKMELDKFWQERREKLSIHSQPNFQFVAQPGLSDADFVTGYVLYIMALKQRVNADKEGMMSFLSQAMDYSSLHAARVIIDELVKQPIYNKQSHCLQLAQALDKLQGFAHQYGTPGYLILAEGYLQLAAQEERIGDTVCTSAAYVNLLKYLNLAHFAEADSAAAIHNTYFGLGLSLSNPFKLDTVELMLTECSKLAEKYVIRSQRNLIKNQALQEYTEQIRTASMRAS